VAVPVFEIGPVDQNVVYAFFAGFVIAWLIFGIRILVLKSRNNREVRNLKANLLNRIDVETTSFDRMRKEIEELNSKNANLKVSMHNLSSKPGRREKLQLQVYQTAIEKMSVRAPGFAPAWQIVLQECEQEAGRSLDGTIPFVKRILPAVGTGWISSPDEAPVAEIVSDSELSGKNIVSRKKGTKSLFSRLIRKKE
jgi:hypothetical protein